MLGRGEKWVVVGLRCECDLLLQREEKEKGKRSCGEW